MAFAAYPSITNRQKDFQRWATKACDDGTVWVATPKFHGTNMSVIVTADGGVTYARRNGVLSMEDKFYGFQSVLPKFRWNKLCALFPAAHQVTVFGELYGGIYGNVVTQPVQKTVQYDPNLAFVAFDVQVDGKFLDVYDARAVCTAIRVPFVPILFRGLAPDVWTWARAHAEDPAVVLRKDLPVLPKNTGEGFVIRPTRETHHDGDRALVKVKSATFDETCKCKQDSVKPERTVIDIPFGRVEAVLSKLDPSVQASKYLPPLAEALLKDILKDQPELVPKTKDVYTNCFRVLKLYLEKRPC